MFKRAIYSAIAIAIIICITAVSLVSVAAETDVAAISYGPKSKTVIGTINDTFVYKCAIKSNETIAGGQFDLTYPNGVFGITNTTVGKKFKDTFDGNIDINTEAKVETEENNIVHFRMNFYSGTGIDIKTNTLLVTIEFEPKTSGSMCMGPITCENLITNDFTQGTIKTTKDYTLTESIAIKEKTQTQTETTEPKIVETETAKETVEDTTVNEIVETAETVENTTINKAIETEPVEVTTEKITETQTVTQPESTDPIETTVETTTEKVSQKPTQPATKQAATEAVETTSPKKSVTKIEIGAKKTAYAHKFYKLNAKIINGVGKTKYYTSNKKIIRVDKTGKIYTVKKGTAKIKISNNGVSKIVTVKVKNPYVTEKCVVLTVGEKSKIKIKGKSGKQTYKTADKTIAGVTKKGRIIARSCGQTKIKVTTNKGIKIKVTVDVV